MRNRFPKGNKYGKGGKRNPPGGRPTKVQQEFKRLAAEMVKKYIEERIKPVVDTYLRLAGWTDGKGRRKVDPATVRHVIERFVPPATKKIDLGRDATAEDFYRHVMGADLDADGEPKQITDKSDEPLDPDKPPDRKKMH